MPRGDGKPSGMKRDRKPGNGPDFVPKGLARRRVWEGKAWEKNEPEVRDKWTGMLYHRPGSQNPRKS